MTDPYTPESRFLTINGLRLHHLDWGNPQAPPLVCIHGRNGSAHAFDALARRLRDRFHVIAIDVRGRGESDWAPDETYEISDYVADLEGIVDSLDLQSFILLGTSMGGRIGMNYIARHPDRLEALILNDQGPDSEPGPDGLTQDVSAPASFPTIEALLAYRRQRFPGLAALSEEDLRERTRQVYRQAADGQFVEKMDPAIRRQRATQGTPPSQPELWPVFANFRRRTLVIWGTNSDVLSEGQARLMVETLPMGELVAVPGVGHAPTLSEPAAVEALDRFLNKVLATQTAAIATNS